MSIENPEEYWGKISENTVWSKPWTKVLDNSRQPFTKWSGPKNRNYHGHFMNCNLSRFVNGKLNMCYNAVDRHVDEGNGERTAIIWDSPITGSKEQWTYSRLQKEVSGEL